MRTFILYAVAVWFGGWAFYTLFRLGESAWLALIR